MDEDNQAQEVLAELVETDSTSELTADQLRTELTKVRREAAAKRVENNALKATQAELQKYKDAEKSELELLTERATRAEAQAQSLAHEKLVLSIAKEAGLDADLADFLKGSDEESLRASATALAAKLGSKEPARTDLFAGSRGEPVRAQTDNAASAFRNLFQ